MSRPTAAATATTRASSNSDDLSSQGGGGGGGLPPPHPNTAAATSSSLNRTMSFTERASGTTTTTTTTGNTSKPMLRRADSFNVSMSRVKTLMEQYYIDPNAPTSSSHRASLLSGGSSTQMLGDPDTMDMYNDVDELDEEEMEERRRGAGNLNSPYFRVDTYFTELLENKSFLKLHDEDERTVREIKQLDKDVQNLVYENYQKFIGATDMMRSMKDKLFKMEGEVNGLEARIEQIANVTKRMNERNATKRGEVARLDRLGKLLSKLEDLYELPARLTTSDDLLHLGELVHFYVQAAPFLSKQADIPTLSAIASSARTALFGVKSRMVARLHATNNTDMEQGSDIVDLLVATMSALQESRESTAKFYFQWHFTKISSEIQRHAAHTTATTTTTTTTSTDTPPPSSPGTPIPGGGVKPAVSPDDIEEFFTDDIQACILEPLTSVVKRAQRFNEWKDDEIVQTLCIEFTKELLKVAYMKLRQRFDNEPSHFKLFSSHASPSLIGQHKASSTSLAGLGFVIRELTSFNSHLPSFIQSRLGLNNRVVEMGERAIRTQINATITELQRRASERLATELPMDETRPESLRREVDDCVIGLLEDAKAARLHLDVIVKEGKEVLEDLSSEFETNFKTQLQDWCLWLADSLRPTGVVVARTIRVRSLCRAIIASNLAAKVEQLRLMEVIAVKEAFKRASHECVKSFYVQTGMEAAKHTVCAETLREKEETHARPSHVHVVVISMIDEVGNASKVLRAAGVVWSSSGLGISTQAKLSSGSMTATPVRVGSSSSGGGSGKLGGGSGVGSNNTSVMPSSSMFSDRVNVFGKVELECESILSAALVVALKTWMETVREVALSTSGFQQLQLDAQFLRYMAPALIKDTSQLSRMVFEFVASAKDRCMNPQLLENNVVDALCAAMKDKVKVQLWMQGGLGSDGPSVPPAVTRGNSAASGGGGGVSGSNRRVGGA